MADEALEQQGEEQEPQGPAFSTKGWVILVTVVLIEAIVFTILFLYQRTDLKKEEQEAAEGVKQDAAFFRKYVVPLKSLDYTVMTASQMATLSMEMQIVLGKSEKEKESPNEEPPSDELMRAYMATVMAMEPDIRDELQRIIDNKTVQQLVQPDGKKSIKNDIKAFVNDRLDDVKFDEGYEEKGTQRVQEVMITRFLLQR